MYVIISEIKENLGDNNKVFNHLDPQLPSLTHPAEEVKFPEYFSI